MASAHLYFPSPTWDARGRWTILDLLRSFRATSGTITAIGIRCTSLPRSHSHQIAGRTAGRSQGAQIKGSESI